MKKYKIYLKYQTSFYDKNLWKCICLCALIGILSFGFYIFTDSGIFVLRADFNEQQIPFITAANGALKNWSGEWCWNIDLGTQLIGGYSFYNLGSPFFWISLLFDKNVFPYIVGILYIFKYIIAGCTSYLYIKLFVKDTKYAILGALLYAFSGFQSVNLLFYHFHDVVAFFPLLLLGIENALQKKRYVLFIIAIFLNCLTNYFFFIGEVIFLILYFLFKFWDKPQNMLKNAIICVMCGILGVGMASILFIPSILFILGNSRSHSKIYLNLLFPSPMQFFYYIKGFLLPGEAMNNQSCVFNREWNSTSCYLPLIGISPTLAYLLKKRDWLAKILIVLLITAFSPLLSSVFYLFTSNYQRWWYMLVLLMCVSSSIVLERKDEFSIKKAILINIVVLLAFSFALIKVRWSQSIDTLIFRKVVFTILVISALSGLLWVIIAVKNRRKYYNLILYGVSIFCCMTTSCTIYLYRQNSTSAESYLNNYVLGSKLKELDKQYRYNLLDNITILSGDAIGVWSFDSTVSPSIVEFDRTFGYERGNASLNINTIPGLSQLLAAKYRLVDTIIETDTVEDIIDVNGKRYYVIADETSPIGFAYDSYVLMEDLMAVDTNFRGIIALDNLVIDSEDEDKVSFIIRKNKAFDYTSDAISISDIVKKNLENTVDDFHRDNSGFSCETNYDEKKVVFFSVPYDEGWQASVDGVSENIIKANGMMAIIVPKGKHNILFHYKTPGLRTGIWISFIFFFIFASYIVYRMIKRQNHTA